MDGIAGKDSLCFCLKKVYGFSWCDTFAADWCSCCRRTVTNVIRLSFFSTSPCRCIHRMAKMAKCVLWKPDSKRKRGSNNRSISVRSQVCHYRKFLYSSFSFFSCSLLNIFWYHNGSLSCRFFSRKSLSVLSLLLQPPDCGVSLTDWNSNSLSPSPVSKSKLNKSKENASCGLWYMACVQSMVLRRTWRLTTGHGRMSDEEHRSGVRSMNWDCLPVSIPRINGVVVPRPAGCTNWATRSAASNMLMLKGKSHSVMKIYLVSNSSWFSRHMWKILLRHGCQTIAHTWFK